MSDPVTFLLACLALLATPGPTNILLAMAGAGHSFFGGLRLILASMSGFLISTLLLGLLLGPLLDRAPLVGVLLKGLCALYLVWLAVKLWRQGSASLVTAGPVGFGAVFTATLLNPKALILAFVIVPHLRHGRLDLSLPYLSALSGLIAAVGLGWLSLGRALHSGSGGRLTGGLVRQSGAAALLVFAIALGGSMWTEMITG